MDTKQNQTPEITDPWEPCPAGELQGLAKRLKHAESRRQQMSAARLAGATAASTAALVVAIGLMFGGDHNPVIGGLSCTDCQANFSAYYGHLNDSDEITGELADQMASHLMKCPMCREMFEDKHPGELERAGILSASIDLEWRPIGGLGYALAY